MLSEATKLWLEISLAKGAGSGRWIALAGSMPIETVAAMMSSEEGRERIFRIIGRAVSPAEAAAREKLLESIEKAGCRIIAWSDEEYPPLLREIAEPPLVLYARGNPATLSLPAVSIVGSRRASRRGLIEARALAKSLASAGVVIASGLARGIDSAAHEGALAARNASAVGAGVTIAVLGCGIDLVYPPENAALADRIAAGGCIVTELPPGTPPLRHNFPRRNRILSGISLGVVVVEAPLGSGAMGTARWAVEQSREVFAVPGPVEHPGSRGQHRLIKEGAFLVEEAQDVIDLLPESADIAERVALSPDSPLRDDFTTDERRVIAALELDPKHIDELVDICHIPSASMQAILLELEIRGAIVACGGGTYALAANR